jgi:1,4-alpha-glucan branching enzyme
MRRTESRTETHLAPDPANLARLVAGAHHNPHGILGAHEHGGHTIIRAFRPHALEVVAIVGDDRFPLQHIESGLFAVALPFVNLIDYRLEVSYQGPGGAPVVHSVADAYRFLPTLGEMDLHLFGEGRHERLWDVLGAHPRSFTTADGVVDGVSFAVWAVQRLER